MMLRADHRNTQRRSVGVAGYFASGKSKAGGQEAKTIALTQALKARFGEDQILCADTTAWTRYPVRLFCNLVKLVRRCDNVVMLPAHKGLRIFLPILLTANKRYHKGLFYSVIGGWMPDLAKKHPMLQWELKRLDGIFVETPSMKQALEQMGFSNVYLVPNFKDLQPVRAEDLNDEVKWPLRLCTFSRVMPEKGIEDAVLAVKEVNRRDGGIRVSLDIYGRVNADYMKAFENLSRSFPPFITYCGEISPDESVQTLRRYDALLFPTHFDTEGVPGTIIDAYMAGLPVISAVWKNSEGVLFEGETSWGFPLGDLDAFTETLTRLINHPEEFLQMRRGCVEHAQLFRPEAAIDRITACFR